jgi:hypothetical protein
VIGPTPLLDFFKRGEVDRDTRMLAAEGALAPRAVEQLMILVLLLEDPDREVRATAEGTLDRIPESALKAFLSRSDVPIGLREFFGDRGIFPDELPQIDVEGELDADAPLVESGDDLDLGDENETAESATQKIAKMSFLQRLKAATKGSREMRAILIRDPNKMISAAVLSSPKITENEIESYARMASLSDEVLRIIGHNRSWTKNYKVVLGLVKNPKTPLALSLNFMSRLNSTDLKQVSVDRNVPETLRVAARKRVVSNQSGKN